MTYQKTVFRRIQADISRIGRQEARQNVAVYMTALYSLDLEGKIYFYEQDRDGLPLGRIRTRLLDEPPFHSTLLIRNTLDASAWSAIARPSSFVGERWPPLVRADLLGCRTLTELCAECDQNNEYRESHDVVYLDWVKQKFQLWHENIDIRLAPHTGYGLYARNTIPAHCYIGEYTGIVLPINEELSNDETEYHFGIEIGKLQLKDTEAATQPICWIDATKKGSVFRFMAHSCAPNAGVTAARVGSHNRVLAVYTKNTISPGEAITIDYGSEWFNTPSQRCHCGTTNCKNPPDPANNEPEPANDDSDTV